MLKVFSPPRTLFPLPSWSRGLGAYGRSGGRPGPVARPPGAAPCWGRKAAVLLQPCPGRSRQRRLGPRRTKAPTNGAPNRSPRCGALLPERGSPAVASGSAGKCGPGYSSAPRPHCRGPSGAGGRACAIRGTRPSSDAPHGEARPRRSWPRGGAAHRRALKHSEQTPKSICFHIHTCSRGSDFPAYRRLSSSAGPPRTSGRTSCRSGASPALQRSPSRARITATARRPDQRWTQPALAVARSGAGGWQWGGIYKHVRGTLFGEHPEPGGSLCAKPAPNRQDFVQIGRLTHDAIFTSSRKLRVCTHRGPVLPVRGAGRWLASSAGSPRTSARTSCRSGASPTSQKSRRQLQEGGHIGAHSGDRTSAGPSRHWQRPGAKAGGWQWGKSTSTSEARCLASIRSQGSLCAKPAPNRQDFVQIGRLHLRRNLHQQPEAQAGRPRMHTSQPQ